MLTTSHQCNKCRNKFRPIAEINVTPMVDVMLVLLIIFMVAAPLLITGVHVDLPRTSTNPLKEIDKSVTVTVNGQGQIFVQETPVTFEELGAHLVTVSGYKPEVYIFVRGDKEIPYGKIMNVINVITSSGFPRVALVANPPEIAPLSSNSRKGVFKF